MFVDNLAHCVFQQNDKLVKRLNLSLQLDTVNEKYRNRYIFASERVKKGVLEAIQIRARSREGEQEGFESASQS